MQRGAASRHTRAMQVRRIGLPAIALVAAGAAELSRLPAAHADVLIATQGDRGSLFIDRAKPDKLEPVYDEADKGVVAYAWSDAVTLWVLRNDNGYTIGSIVDGKPGPTRPLGALKVATPGHEVPTGWNVEPWLAATRSGQVLVVTCTGISKAPSTDHLMHCTNAFRRVDDGSNTDTTARPKDIVFEKDTETKPTKLSPIKQPPAGYAAKIVKTKVKSGTVVGAECTGPGTRKWSWPDLADAGGDDFVRFTPKVTKLEWLSATPAILHLVASGKSPVGEDLHQDHVVIDCTEEISDARPLRDGLMIADRKIRKATGEVIGELRGSGAVVAP